MQMEEVGEAKQEDFLEFILEWYCTKINGIGCSNYVLVVLKRIQYLACKRYHYGRKNWEVFPKKRERIMLRSFPQL